ncbi:hypothetical protein GC169_05975 [bacterium]|nr:hypothetical protein [bacterium]
MARLAFSFPNVRAVVGLALLGLSACSSFESRPNVGPCPVAGALYEASRLVEVQQPNTHENVGFTGEINGVRGFCRYVDDDPITMEVDVDFAFGRGPKAQGDAKTYGYWVAVTRRDQAVIAKQYFTMDVKFPRGAEIVRKTERIDGIVIPRASETVSGRNFEVIVGFDLSDEQLTFNRSGVRFRLQQSEP